MPFLSQSHGNTKGGLHLNSLFFCWKNWGSRKNCNLVQISILVGRNSFVGPNFIQESRFCEHIPLETIEEIIRNMFDSQYSGLQASGGQSLMFR